ncbi:MAG: autotransporter outer membrane beta-barrel domain-containing protein [Acidobacteriota bacterium]
MSGSPIPTKSVLQLLLPIVCATFIGTAAFAQTPLKAPPPSLDAELQRLLALGDAAGCLALLGDAPRPDVPNGQVVEAALKRFGPQIGNELRAICGPSAVNSASSLGGGLNTLQATKTVTQFRLARRRIDQRLAAPPKKQPAKSVELAFVQAASSSSLTSAPEAPEGPGVFGELEFDWRDRVDTSYEAGYQSNVKGFSIGLDYLRGGTIVGGWFGRTQQDAEFTRFGALLDSRADSASRTLLGQDSVRASVCGGLSNPGTFEQESTRLGGFAGVGGSAGFMDATFGWSRHHHEYARSVCAIEASTPLSLVNGVLIDGTGRPVDDIFAGTLRGINTIRETSFSVRGGASLGNAFVTVGPRAILTVSRASTDAFVETGRSTVANPVVPVSFADPVPVPVTRSLGGPIGFELAFDEQSRTSVLLETGAEISGRAGALIPHVAGYYRREFKDDFHLVTARFAQDRRQAPTRFTFGNDRFDPDSFVFGVGVTALGGDRFAVRAELTTLVSDYLFSSRTLSAQARVRF